MRYIHGDDLISQARGGDDGFDDIIAVKVGDHFRDGLRFHLSKVDVFAEPLEHLAVLDTGDGFGSIGPESKINYVHYKNPFSFFWHVDAQDQCAFIRNMATAKVKSPCGWLTGKEALSVLVRAGSFTGGAQLDLSSSDILPPIRWHHSAFTWKWPRQRSDIGIGASVGTDFGQIPTSIFIRYPLSDNKKKAGHEIFSGAGLKGVVMNPCRKGSGRFAWPRGPGKRPWSGPAISMRVYRERDGGGLLGDDGHPRTALAADETGQLDNFKGKSMIAPWQPGDVSNVFNIPQCR